MNRLGSLRIGGLRRVGWFVLVGVVTGCADSSAGTTSADTGGEDDVSDDAASSGSQTDATSAGNDTTGASDPTESTAGGTGGSTSVACDDPMPILQPDGTPTGFVQCSDGFVHRVEAVTCIVPEAPASCGDPEAPRPPPCSSPADCVEGVHGACLPDIGGISCSCEYSCESDAQCSDGFICACAGVGNLERPACVPADCNITADCDGGLCGLSVAGGCLGRTFYGLGCLDETAQCRTSTCDDFGDGCVCRRSGGEWGCYDECTCG